VAARSEADSAPFADSASLTRAIAAGDETAFTVFYRSWFAAALALARAASRRDEAFCLDIVQDVMWTVCRKLPALADDRAVRAWMVRAVGNAVVDRLRNERSRQQREASVVMTRGATAAGDAGVALAANEQQGWLAARVLELSPSDQALLAARFGDGASVAAAGAAFGLTADSAHSRLRRVLGRLRTLATEWWHGA
jgi:RNA polymerase sigma factor (sigma-70 family)